MHRRTFILAAISAATFPKFALAGETIDYTPGVIQKALDEGKTVFVDYATDWCSTCAAQERMIERLRGENAEYDKNIVFVRVDFDEYANKPVSTDRNIPRRSTLIVLHGDQELGRVVAVASKRKIQGLLDAGLKAAMS
jgi:thioredoxin 1